MLPVTRYCFPLSVLTGNKYPPTIPIFIPKLSNPLYPQLNFPPYEFRIRKNERELHEIFDKVRKKFVALTPEEWVRQHLLEFLMQEKKFPLSLLAVEKQLKLNSTLKRTDVMAYTNTLKPLLLAECKAPEIKLDIHTLTQALRYNLVFDVSYLVITNGLEHYFFYKDKLNPGWQRGDSFPDYTHLLKTG